MKQIKNATILFPPDLCRHLAHLAKQRGTSVGELVRAACWHQYPIVTAKSRLAAVREMGRLKLPVGSPEQMEAESAPSVEPDP